MLHNLVAHFAHDVGWGPTILAIAMLVVALLCGAVQWLRFELRLAYRVLRRTL